MRDRINILGASGSGTTTLAAAFARAHGHTHLDSDDFLWEPTDPPYQHVRAREQRQSLVAAALDAAPRFVLSGSLCGWGDIFVPRFDLVVFLTVPTPIRLERLRARELARCGADAIAPGGARHEASTQFLTWAAAYDDGDHTIRSRALHDAWLAKLPCPVLRLDGTLPPSDLVAAIALRGSG